MRSLAQHFARVRRAHPDDRLLIVFDFYGTVIDRSHTARHLLLEYDRVHGTDHFHGLQTAELEVHGNQLELVMAERDLPASVRMSILLWSTSRQSQPDFPIGRDRAHPGVMEVMRWFQLQPSIFVGLTTSRPARLRHETLQSVNRLGRGLRAEFDAGLLHVNDADSVARGVDAKVEALSAFAGAGYRTFAVVDSHAAVIQALARTYDRGDVFLLHFGNPRPAGLLPNSPDVMWRSL